MANITVTYTFSNATTADATEINSNFSDVISGTSDGTKDFSINDLTLAGTGTFNGNVSFGNATGDTITTTGRLASTLNPSADDTYDLGSTSLQFRALYGSDFIASLGATATPSFTFNGDTNTGVWSSAADTVNISTGGTERFEIDSAEATFAVPVATSGTFIAPLGSAALPSITFSGDLNTGVWSSAADTINWSTAGVERMELDATSLNTTVPVDISKTTAISGDDLLVVQQVSNATNVNYLKYKTNAGSTIWSCNYDSGGDLLFTTENSSRTISFQTNGGFFGINIAAPDYQLDVRDSVSGGQVAQIYNTNTGSTDNGLIIRIDGDNDSSTTNKYIRFAGSGGADTGKIENASGTMTLTSLSDRRIKTDINPLEIDALSMVMDIPVVSYRKKHAKDTILHGFIAQDVHKHIPQAAKLDKESDRYYLSQEQMIHVAWKAIQELNTKIETRGSLTS